MELRIAATILVLASGGAFAVAQTHTQQPTLPQAPQDVHANAQRHKHTAAMHDSLMALLGKEGHDSLMARLGHISHDSLLAHQGHISPDSILAHHGNISHDSLMALHGSIAHDSLMAHHGGAGHDSPMKHLHLLHRRLMEHHGAGAVHKDTSRSR